MEVHGHTVRGVDVGPETRCRHYDSELDVIAIRFPCCETFYPCYECHLAAADHEPERWGDESGGGARASVEGSGSADRTGAEDEGSADRTGAEDTGSAMRTGAEDEGSEERTATGDDADAVLCGICGTVLTVAEYVDCDDRCPDCGAEFNPGCRRHYDRYFASELFETSA
ncbi:CHY zinc finger protein [Halolamina rubra]|uniref:CHY zinc finger protein n=1 Tax=Halolamina rubra TaxID=1380430 RepID=UPI0006784BDA|nr:CHY zinc finger protein [Halolamina rubra]